MKTLRVKIARKFDIGYLIELYFPFYPFGCSSDLVYELKHILEIVPLLEVYKLI